MVEVQSMSNTQTRSEDGEKGVTAVYCRVSKNEEKKHGKVFHIDVKNFLFGEVINIDAIL